eukprot:scaffold5678_cov394-Prasinococcus_capsulatus_cf.AAC.5
MPIFAFLASPPWSTAIKHRLFETASPSSILANWTLWVANALTISSAARLPFAFAPASTAVSSARASSRSFTRRAITRQAASCW